MEITIIHSDNHCDYGLVDDDVNTYKVSFRKGRVLPLDIVLFGIRKEEYPDAKGTTLAKIEQWIAENPTVEPIPWTSTHPKEAGQKYQTDLQSYKDSPLYNKSQVQIDSYIDNISDVPTVKNALKEITRVLKIMMHNVED